MPIPLGRYGNLAAGGCAAVGGRWLGDKRGRWTGLTTLATILSLLVGGGWAQESASSGIVGRLTDSSGSVISGATVHVLNLGTGAERTATTNDTGDFNILNLPPAAYSVRVEKSGFKTYSIAHVDLLVGQIATETIEIQVGSTNETIVVSTDPPQLQTEDATVGQVISEKQVSNLPLNGRNILQLATLSAGVSGAAEANTGAPDQAGNRSQYVTVDGGRASSNNYVIDGVYVRSLRFDELSIQPSVDTIQEFNLLRSSFGTEYGQGGAVVSMVTKSGSNALHGSAFTFARSGIFDARDYFATVAIDPKKPVYHRNQFGGTVGGPLIKGKVFFFGGFEGLRTAQEKPYSGFFPTPAQLTGATSHFAQAFIPAIPVPNCTTCGSSINYTEVTNFIDNYNETTIRSDQVLSSKHSLFERYIGYSATQLQTPYVAMRVSFPQTGQNVAIGDTYLLSGSLINEFRLGYNLSSGYAPSINPVPGKNWVSAVGLQNLEGGLQASDYGPPLAIVIGYSLMGVFGNLQGDTENIYSIGDSLIGTFGHHSMHTGFQIQERQVAQIVDQDTHGTFVFPSVDAFLSGFSVSSTGGLGSSLGHYTDQTYGVFVNDVWKPRGPFTINAGIRWEYIAPFVEKDGLEGSFDFSSGLIAFNKVPSLIPASMAPYVDTKPGVFSPGIVKPDRNGYGPRVGVAYRATNRTVARAGYGIYFENTNTNELQFTRVVPPLYIDNNVGAGPVDGLFPSLNALVTVPAPYALLPSNRTPYTEEWTASIEQDLGHQTMFELAYTGSSTHKLWKRFDANEDTTFGANAVRPYPQFAHGMFTSANVAGANFNGLSAKLEQRPIEGLYYLVSYQFSKNLDNASGEAGANDTTFSTNFRFDHSYSNFDVRNRGVGSIGYELPFGKNKQFVHGTIGNAIAGGWQVQSIVSMRSGFPFDVTAGGGDCTCGYHVPQRANLAPGFKTGIISNPTINMWFNPAAYAAPANGYQGNVTRNTLLGPGGFQNDLSFIKNINIHENLNGQFRAEAFNIANHPTFATPGNNVSTPGAGVVTATSGENRDLQFAFKLLW